jgi:hypothetical protein
MLPGLAAVALAAPPPPGSGTAPTPPPHSPLSSAPQAPVKHEPSSRSQQQGRNNTTAQAPLYGLHLQHGGEQRRLPAFGRAEEVVVAEDIFQLWRALQEGEWEQTKPC